MVFELITLGGVIFWILTALAAIAIIAAVEVGSGRNATGVIVLFALLIILFSNAGEVGLFRYLGDHPLRILLFIVVYIIGGVVWAIVKWYFFLLHRRDEAAVFKKEFLANQGIEGDVIPDDLKQRFHDDLARSYSYKGVSFPPDVKEHRRDILTWATYWPFSAFWTLLNDPIRRAWAWIYARIAGLFQNVANKMMSDI